MKEPRVRIMLSLCVEGLTISRRASYLLLTLRLLLLSSGHGVSVCVYGHVDTHLCPSCSKHLLFEGLCGEVLDRNYRCVEMHLFVGLGEILEIKLEVRGESLPIGLLIIPALHAYIPGLLVIIIYAVMGRYSLDGICIRRHSECC